MQVIKSKAEFAALKDNRLVGEAPAMIDSTISFSGRNNILFCEKGVCITNSAISFNGDGAVIVIRSSPNALRLTGDIYNSSVLHIGQNVYINRMLYFSCSERKHIIIGDNCMFSMDTWMRTSDVHLIYSCEDNMRINPSCSIFIGDHVWVGHEAMLLKGTQIGSGSIIGARGLVTGKRIPSNAAWGGSPARQLNDGVFWDGKSVHNWTEQNTEYRETFRDGDVYKFAPDENSLDFDEIDRRLTAAADAGARLAVINNVMENTASNRFAV